MTKQRKNEFDNLYKFSQNLSDNNLKYSKDEKTKNKEREKRIKQKKNIQKDKFDIDTETVIGMTNKNNKQAAQNQQKKMTKKQAQIIRKKKKIKKIVKLITLVLFIIAGITFALVSPIFNISEIQVYNNNQLTTETIISLSQLQVGQNLFKFSSNKVEKEIKTNPYIESVLIKRKFPNKIEITVEERQKNYNVEFLNGYAYINNQGYIIEISETKLELPTIQGISTEQEQIVPGNRLNNQDLSKLETVIQIMNICKNYEIDSKITSIDITDKTNYTLYMKEEKKTIYLGDDFNLSNKMLYVPTILQENQGKEGTIYINGDINNNFKPRFRENLEK